MKKNLLSRITRRKGPTPVEAGEEGYELPPPSVIEPGVPYSAKDMPDSDYDSHRELELLAYDEPARADSTNGAEARESDAAPALESMTAPDTDEFAPKSNAALYEEYDLDIETLTESESEAVASVVKAPAPEPEVLHESEPEAAADAVAEASMPEPEMPQEIEPEAVDELVQEVEPPAESVKQDSPDTPAPKSKAALYEEYDLDIESLTESESDDSPGEAEPPDEQDEAVSVVEESVVEATESDPVVPQESELEAVEDVSPEEEMPPAESVLQDSPEESPEPSRAETGISPHVRDARGRLRPGKGFSRSELREAGLSLADAARLNIRVDKRRRNVHPVNVAALEKAKSGV